MTDIASWVALAAPITTLAGGLGGYWLAGRNEEARDKRASAREADSRHATLAERLEDKRHAFQLDTLLTLQDGLQRAVLATAKIQGGDLNTLRLGNELDFGRIAVELSEEWTAAIRSIPRLRTRVLDPDLREAIERFEMLCASYIMFRTYESEKSAEGRFARFQHQTEVLAAAHKMLTERLGERIRYEMGRTPEDVTAGPT